MGRAERMSVVRKFLCKLESNKYSSDSFTVRGERVGLGEGGEDQEGEGGREEVY